MTTFTWAVSGFSSAANLVTANRPVINHTIPPTGILKRFQVRNNAILGEQSTTSVDRQPPMVVVCHVIFTDVHSVDREIFHGTFRVPSSTTALYDPATLERVYGRFHEAGDRELEINQGCSYGKHTDGGSKFVRFESALFGDVYGATLNAAGYQQYEFAALYETIP
jgi:hypothetical protein